MLLPIALLCAGLAWVLSASAVYFRDVSQMVGVLVTVLFFTSPVFFPLEGLGPGSARWLEWNPLTFPIEQSRALLLVGRPAGLACITCATTACAGVFAAIALWLFRRAQRGFADVL
jgi:lipopolysaccharide transport system permease protein